LQPGGPLEFIMESYRVCNKLHTLHFVIGMERAGLLGTGWQKISRVKRGAKYSAKGGYSTLIMSYGCELNSI
jgi:hypothetical protein